MYHLNTYVDCLLKNSYSFFFSGNDNFSLLRHDKVTLDSETTSHVISYEIKQSIVSSLKQYLYKFNNKYAIH